MTLEERIKLIEMLSIQEPLSVKTGHDGADRELMQYAKGCYETAIEATLAIKELQHENKGLKGQCLGIYEELQNKNKELEAQQEAETMYYESKNENLTRLEVIDESGRAYVNNNCKIELSYQDEGRTLKIFVNNGGVK